MGSSIRHLLQPGFVLHHRAYRDSSLIVDFFTPSHGRVSVVARGVRKARSRLAPLLQPFQPLLISWSGRGDLGTMIAVESDGVPIMLKRRALLSGFYLNELLVRLLQRHDPYETLYGTYLEVLQQLAGLPQSLTPPSSIDEQAVLRRFEKQLLDELGYGLLLAYDVESGDAVSENALYHYHLEQGPVLMREQSLSTEHLYHGERSTSVRVRIHGKSLIDLREGCFRDSESLRECKRLMRAALAAHLGNKPLKSRAMFNQSRAPSKEFPPISGL